MRFRQGGLNKKLIGGLRFSNVAARREMEEAAVQTILCDLLYDKALQELPGDRMSFIYYFLGHVAEKYKDCRIVVFSFEAITFRRRFTH
ncbi:hypothetical protein MNQ98_02360 [Paenibacillus sp. N3/727]|uniref:hypothetical protein n=1 Tax=Paenibacillus sp. N3/727 TaxID=2925845 RepID=UPI001F539C94|nr:hypothetical protein [Paenibacillus sp. N3/727]UNK18912.1 hypothetical protein MNQ98_02360 [Paenibacillus sp. N3/727]